MKAWEGKGCWDRIFYRGCVLCNFEAVKSPHEPVTSWNEKKKDDLYFIPLGLSLYTFKEVAFLCPPNKRIPVGICTNMLRCLSKFVSKNVVSYTVPYHAVNTHSKYNHGCFMEVYFYLLLFTGGLLFHVDWILKSGKSRSVQYEK